jgi:ribosome-associated toxin RatA of RatAB toxin-antitoxin module
MIHITASREVATSAEGVWAIVSATEDEPRYWPGLANLRVLSRKGPVIEREVTVRRGPLGSAKSTQRVELDEERKAVLLTMTKGPMLGARSIRVRPLGKERATVEVTWDFRMEGMPSFAERFVKASIVESTKKALDRIGEAAGKLSDAAAHRRRHQQ